MPGSQSSVPDDIRRSARVLTPDVAFLNEELARADLTRRQLRCEHAEELPAGAVKPLKNRDLRH
jgi:hypothetical protein